jgi:thioredoxin-related protein
MNLKTACGVLLAAMFTHTTTAANWLTDLNAAQAQARDENKLILVNFTGSDWCGWCIKLKNEVFVKPEFDAFASENLVLLEIDFPRQKPMPAATKKANGALADKYKVGGYPTLHVLTADGKSLGNLGYTPGGPNAFVAKLKSIGGDRFKPAKVAETKLAKREAEPETAEAPPAFNGAPTFPAKYYSALELKGVSGPPNARLALINNQTVGAGETAKVKLGDSVVKVKCLEVHDDFAVVMIDGTNQRRELRMRGGL